MRSRLLCYALAFLFAALLAPAAFADGLPVLGVDVGSEGISLPGGADRYVALVSGRETTVARVAVDGGRVLAFHRLTGKLTIPAVAYDGSASGLSANGSTLALIEPRTAFPRATTTFAILDARGLQVRRRISLVGDFSFDALSPDGRTMFLIQYSFPRDPTRYSVRAFDLGRGVLLRRPVVDPNEHEDAMRGSPITRVTSADGRWAYTLYDGAGKTPFVHALDTRERRARCIDLPMLVGRSDLWTLHLRLGAGTTLVVDKGRRSVAQIDRKSFRASAAAPASSHGLSGGVVLPAGLAGLLALAGLGSFLLARRHLRTEGVAPEHAACEARNGLI